eukprot:31270-Pelagococcus_subviridis.AAC.35
MDSATIIPTPRPRSPGCSPLPAPRNDPDPPRPPRAPRIAWKTCPERGVVPAPPPPPPPPRDDDGGGGLNAYLSLSHSNVRSSGFGRGVPGGGDGGFPPPRSLTCTSPFTSLTSCVLCFFGSAQSFRSMSWYRRSPVRSEIW